MVHFVSTLLNTDRVLLKLYTSLCQKAKCTLFAGSTVGLSYWNQTCGWSLHRDSHCCCCWHLQKLTQASWPLHSCHSSQLGGVQFVHPVQTHVNQFLRSQNNTSMLQYTKYYGIRTDWQEHCMLYSKNNMRKMYGLWIIFPKTAFLGPIQQAKGNFNPVLHGK